jgi:hypothetical protein
MLVVNAQFIIVPLQDGIIAAKRIDLSKKGVETCGDVDEVRPLLLGSECCCTWVELDSPAPCLEPGPTSSLGSYVSARSRQITC